MFVFRLNKLVNGLVNNPIERKLPSPLTVEKGSDQDAQVPRWVSTRNFIDDTSFKNENSSPRTVRYFFCSR